MMLTTKLTEKAGKCSNHLNLILIGKKGEINGITYHFG